jgi:hypothetical protein
MYIILNTFNFSEKMDIIISVIKTLLDMPLKDENTVS